MGKIQALSGQMTATGAQTVLRCGAIANTIAISGAKVSAAVDGTAVGH